MRNEIYSQAIEQCSSCFKAIIELHGTCLRQTIQAESLDPFTLFYHLIEANALLRFWMHDKQQCTFRSFICEAWIAKHQYIIGKWYASYIKLLIITLEDFELTVRGRTWTYVAGVLGCVCVRVPAPLVPRHSWLQGAAWLCVLGLGFRLRPATPGWGVEVCVCSCARSACTPPLLAGVYGVGVCAWARVIGCAPPLLARVLGCVCVRVRAPLVPRHSWLGCVVWVCVLRLGFQLRPATPGCGVGVYVWLCARSACTPPLLAGVCGLGVCLS